MAPLVLYAASLSSFDLRQYSLVMFSFVLCVASVNLIGKLFFSNSIFPLAILHTESSYFHFDHVPGETFVLQIAIFPFAFRDPIL